MSFGSEEGPIVQTKQGKLQGIVGEDARGGKYYGFRGIPYAAPPIGPLKFKPPQKPLPWEGIRDASVEGEPCFHRDPYLKQFVGSEDCLYLNVYTPEIKRRACDKLKPVMFWIPGGSYIEGSGSNIIYGPEFLVAEDVVLVTINFRLGILGLLSLDDPDLGIPGNATFKDMVMALRWVVENIENFGGDPQNITVFGESAGGACAHFLMLSPLTKGLFHKAIVQSGSALNTWSTGYKFAREFIKVCGFENIRNDRQIYEVLRDMPLEELVTAQRKYQTSLVYLPNIRKAFGPVVENPNEGAFFTDTPLNILKSGQYTQVPLIIGCTNGEGMFINMCMREDDEIEVMDNSEVFVPFDIPTSILTTRQLADKIEKRYYIPGKPRRECMFNIITDGNFYRSMYKAAQLHFQTSDKPVFLYKATVESKLNSIKRMLRLKSVGLCHGDDIGYIFKSIFTPEITPGSVEDVAQRRFTKLWTNFAKNGDPNSDDPLIPVRWKPLSKNSVPVLEIGKELVLKEDPDREILNFWDNLHRVDSKL